MQFFERSCVAIVGGKGVCAHILAFMCSLLLLSAKTPMCIKVLPEILFYEASDSFLLFFDVLQDSRKLLEKCLLLYKKVPNKRFVTCSGLPFWLIIFCYI